MLYLLVFLQFPGESVSAFPGIAFGVESPSVQKLVQIVLITVVAAIVVVGWRWHGYVTNTESPYDEVGIELNSRMPGPINKWGCDRLHATFGNVLPPYGCQTGDDGRSWR